MKIKLLLLFIVTNLFCLKAQNPIITKWNPNIYDHYTRQFTIYAEGEFTYTFYKEDDPSITGAGVNGPDDRTVIRFPERGIYIVHMYPTTPFKFNFVKDYHFEWSSYDYTNLIPIENNRKIVEIMQWGDVNWKSDLSGMFVICNNLTVTATDFPDFSHVTKTDYMFLGCTNLTTVPGLNNWNTTNLTSTKGMFKNVPNLTENVTQWNTANITNMSEMFQGATNFNQNISMWNTSSVTDLSDMFNYATTFNQPIGVWNTRNVTNFSGMFYHAINFNQNIGNWNTSKATNMSGMFFHAENFNQNIGNWDTSNVTTMASMFHSAYLFNQDIGNWNTTNVESISNIFAFNPSFNQDISNWNVEKIVQYVQSFRNATNFNQNLGKWNLKNNADFIQVFRDSGIDCENYTKTLYGWATKTNPAQNVSIHRNNKSYSAQIQTYLDVLINQYDWRFYDDTIDENCIVDLSEPITTPPFFILFPNPTQGDLTIISDKIQDLIIFDIVGKLLKIQKLNLGVNNLSLHGYSSGVYILKANNLSYRVIKN